MIQKGRNLKCASFANYLNNIVKYCDTKTLCCSVAPNSEKNLCALHLQDTDDHCSLKISCPGSS